MSEEQTIRSVPVLQGVRQEGALVFVDNRRNPIAGGCLRAPQMDETKSFGHVLTTGAVALTPAGTRAAHEAFQPFANGASVEPVRGPQGCAMSTSRLRISGVEAPACVLLSTTVSVDGGPSESVETRVQLHCGLSLTLYTIVPGSGAFCEASGTHRIDLTAEIVGVGSATANLSFEIDEFSDDFCLCSPDGV